LSDNNELTKLKNRLQGKISILGIGNRLRGDDGIGPEIIKRVNKPLSSLVLLDVGETPENYLGKIIREKPNTVVLIDAVDFGAPPGTINIIESHNIGDGSLSTHNISLKIIMEYLQKETSADVFLLGIQPKNTEFGKEISEPVRESLKKIVRMLGET